MDKRIIVGVIAGIILGIAQMLLFSGSVAWIVTPALLGGLIGFLNTQKLPLNFFLLSALAGAAFFVVIAILSGKFLDDIATGALNGLLIGAIIHFLGKSELIK